MLLYIAITVITVSLACMVRPVPKIAGEQYIYPWRVGRQQTINNIVTAAIFMILFLLAALRNETGNDYGTYVVTAHEIFQGGYVITEPGYNLVVKIIYTLAGKEDYFILFAVFAAAIAYIFLRVFREQSDSFVLSFFMFMTMGIYFRTFNTVRYYFVLAIAMYSIRYLVEINRENFIKFILLIALAATFHKSVLIVIPMYLIARIPWKKWMYIFIAATGLLIPLFKNGIISLALKFYPSYLDTVYIEEQHFITENLPVVAACLAVILLCLYCYKEAIRDRADNKMYFHMCIMAVVLYLSCYFIPLVTRFGYYLVTSQILLIPNILASVSDFDKKRRLTALICVLCGLYFLYFLYTADRVGVRVLPYKSFLFYDRYWLNQTDTF